MALPLGSMQNSSGACGEVKALTTNADTALSPPSRWIFCGAAGNLQLTPAWATTSVTLTVFAGEWSPIAAKTVHAAPAGSFAFW